MANAGSNEVLFKETFKECYGSSALLGKQRFSARGASTVEISVDESFRCDDLFVLVEIDSGNAAKLLIGQYVLLNELAIELAVKTGDRLLFLVVHFYKGYNAARTTRNLELMRDVVYCGLGIPFSALSWSTLQQVFRAEGSLRGLLKKLFPESENKRGGEYRLSRLVATSDRKEHTERVIRLKWFDDVLPDSYYAFHGGLTTLSLFEEMRRCFIFGQHIAAVIVGLSFIEHTIASILYTRGYKKVASAAYVRLVQMASDCAALPPDEANDLFELSMVRNRLAHFRKPSSIDKAEALSMVKGVRIADMWEEDAKLIASSAIKVLRARRFSSSF